MQQDNVKGATAAGFVHAAPDRRATGDERRVTIERGRIVIARSVLNITMKIAVPAAAYRGVALAVEELADGGAAYVVDLVHADADLSVRLTQSQCDETAISAWRRWTEYFGLRPLLERRPGVLSPVEADAAGRCAAAAHLRLRRGALKARRSRFALRRKTGFAVVASQRLYDEREMSARD